MAKRGRTIPLGEEGSWWLRLARTAINGDLRPRRVLAVELAKHLPDKAKFDHGHLSKFAAASVDPRTGQPYDPTLDLIEALCKEYRLPPPLFLPRSYNEAVHMLDVAEEYDKRAVPVEVEPTADVTPLPKPDERSRRKPKADAAAAPKPATKRRSRSA